MLGTGVPGGKERQAMVMEQGGGVAVVLGHLAAAGRGRGFLPLAPGRRGRGRGPWESALFK